MGRLKAILCYGDSNTWGFIPTEGKRYEKDIRWTGVLAALLGEQYYVIEEGLNGRTTVFDDPFMEQRNGKKSLIPCLESHAPLDLVILALGANDLKKHLGTTAIAAAKGIGILAEIIRKTPECGHNNQIPKILILAPTPFGTNISQLRPNANFGEDAYMQSLRLAAEYQKVADTLSVQFLDAGKYSATSPRDGLHLEKDSHLSLGKAVYNKLCFLLNE